MKKVPMFLSAFAIAAISSAVHAEDYVITLKDHAFTPQELTIPAGQKVKITVKNQDTTPAEFESHELKREKIINGNSEAVIFVGPLDPGTYGYFDEFHEDTTKGKIIAK
ncbi:MAG: cupredoxin domain-containing protein [Rickettsiales bacterium]